MAQEDIKAAVTKLVGAVSQSEKNGQLRYKVNTEWKGNVLCAANIRNFDPLMVDEPAAFGGSDSSASPVELVLAALGTCQEIMYSALASYMDIPLEECKVKLTGDLDVRGLLGMGESENVPPGFTKITYETQLKSSASSDQLKALANAVQNQCPVLDIITRKSTVSGTVIANGEEVSAYTISE